MAVEVEDHPVDYAAFEGEIPKGQYGGGHVAQFDHGVWATQGDPEAQLPRAIYASSCSAPSSRVDGIWSVPASLRASHSGCCSRMTMNLPAISRQTICWRMLL